MKKLFLLFLILFALTVNATEIIPLPESTWEKIKRCTWHISCYRTPFGATITTIASTDKIKDSRATINTNFTNLNDGKIENSSSSIAAITTLSNLVTVGALSSGSLASGFTTVTVPLGGTGSTTLSANQVLLGNGTSGVLTVTGWGTSGQFLTSNGAATAPTWQSASVNQTSNYAWAGNHNFTGTTLIKNFNASSTVANPLVLNDVSLSFPSTQGASSTIFMNDGNGKLTSNYQQGTLLYATTTGSAKISATSTTMTAFNHLRFDIRIPATQQITFLRMEFNDDIAANYSSEFEVWGTGTKEQNIGKTFMQIEEDSSTTTEAYITMEVENYAANTKIVKIETLVTPNGTTVPKRREGQGIWNNTTNQITSFSLFTGGGANLIPAGTKIRVFGRD